MSGDGPHVSPDVMLVCPFCGGQATAGYDAAGNGVVTHTMPPCERFDALPPDEYLRECRLAMAPEQLS